MAENHFDDPNIPDEERLFRRINLVHLVEGENGQALLSSGAFSALELSVDIEGLMRDAGRDPGECLKNYPAGLLVSITAGECRRHAQLVGKDPLPDNSAHGYVFGKKSSPTKKALRDAVRWIVPEQSPSWEEVLSLKDQSPHHLPIQGPAEI